jgi:hypothetical protein
MRILTYHDASMQIPGSFSISFKFLQISDGTLQVELIHLSCFIGVFGCNNDTLGSVSSRVGFQLRYVVLFSRSSCI